VRLSVLQSLGPFELVLSFLPKQLGSKLLSTMLQVC
jgi:hypothetical protein